MTTSDVWRKSIDSSGCQQHVSSCWKFEDEGVTTNHHKFIKEAAAAAVCQERMNGLDSEAQMLEHGSFSNERQWSSGTLVDI